MTAVARVARLASGLLGAAGFALLAACSYPGDLSISNRGPQDVTVRTGGDEVVVESGGGAVLLGFGCTEDDVTVDFATGPDAVLPGPVCHDQRIVVGDGTAELLPATVTTD